MARPKAAVPTERLCVTLPAGEVKAAKAAATTAGVTWADFVRQALLSQAALDRGVLPPRPIRRRGFPQHGEPIVGHDDPKPVEAHVHKAGEMRSGGFRPCVVRGCSALRIDGRWVES